MVTGAGSGIGRATALAFALEGASVIVADIKPDAGNQTVQLIDQCGGQASFIEIDVTKPADVEAMIQGISASYGRLDCAFNNAGIIGPLGWTPVEYPEEAWQQVLGVNLTGVWACTKYEIRQMLAQEGGAIVNMASIAGIIANEHVAYIASKHGVLGLTKAFALAYAKTNIRVNAVCPGFVDTPLLDPIIKNDPKIAAELASTSPLGRLGRPEEVAEAVLWLCSDASSLANGSALVVDGGHVVR